MNKFSNLISLMVLLKHIKFISSGKDFDIDTAANIFWLCDRIHYLLISNTRNVSLDINNNVESTFIWLIQDMFNHISISSDIHSLCLTAFTPVTVYANVINDKKHRLGTYDNMLLPVLSHKYHTVKIKTFDNYL